MGRNMASDRDRTTISLDMHRAVCMFTRPGVGRSIYQEDKGKIDHKLRSCIEKAHEAFWKESKRLDALENDRLNKEQ